MKGPASRIRGPIILATEVEYGLPLGFEVRVPDFFHRGDAFVIYPDRLVWFQKRDRIRLPLGYRATTNPAPVLGLKSNGPKVVVSWSNVVAARLRPIHRSV